MANLNQILNSILNVAKTVAPLLGPQVAGAAAAAAAIQKLISDAKAAAGGTGNPATLAELERLQQEVGARARATIDGLRGGGGGS